MSTNDPPPDASPSEPAPPSLTGLTLPPDSQPTKPTILVVDDTNANLALMNNLLKQDYRVKVANHGSKVMKIATTSPEPDVILLDIMMPDMDGYEVCRQLKANPQTRDIPVIFLTAMSEAEDEEKGLKLGAVDYITKPFSPPIVLARIRTQLHARAYTELLKDKADFLEREVRSRTREVNAIQDVCIQALASLAETRDNETGNHIRRTQHYVRSLARKLQHHPKFAPELSNENIRLLFKSAPLHDIGKVGIPDNILLKPGKLTTEEFEIMKQHAALGKLALEAAEKSLDMRVGFLIYAKQIANSHHERWDGKGYPEKLAGDAIPLAARLMSVADVYDALISRRVYKEPMPHSEAAAFIRGQKGTMFDPDVVEAFNQAEEDFVNIAAQYSDGD